MMRAHAMTVWSFRGDAFVDRLNHCRMPRRGEYVATKNRPRTSRRRSTGMHRAAHGDHDHCGAVRLSQKVSQL